MKVIVFGASGRTGRQVVQQAVARGHDVTAFVRAGSEAALEGAGASGEGQLHTRTGDIFDVAAVTGAVEGQEAVLCTLGSSSLTGTTVRSQGTRNIVQAMTDAGVSRLVVMSAMGVGESWSTLSPFNKLIFATLLFASRRDHEAQEAAVKGSGLDWTIVRASGLTDGPHADSYGLGEAIRGETARIARADVAKAMLDALQDEALVRKAVSISN